MSLSAHIAKTQADQKVEPADNIDTDDTDTEQVIIKLLSKMLTPVPDGEFCKAAIARPLVRPELKRAESVAVAPVSDDDDEPISFKNCMFISDKPLSDNIKTQLGFKDVRPFDSNFTNRKPSQLLAAQIDHIWIDLSDSKARHWLELNLKKNCYTRVLIHERGKNQKFLKDLESHCDVVTKLKDVKRLSALSFDELMGQMGDMVKIHSPASCLGELLGCSKNINKKSKNA